MYDQLLWSIRESMWNIFNMVNKSVKYWTYKNKQTRHRAPQHLLLGLKSEKSGNLVSYFQNFEKYFKFAHDMSVQNGCDAFPNELMRFRIEVKPIWGKSQKHCKTAVII